MTIKILNENINYGQKHLIGLSTDTKPTTVDAGSTFTETNTGNKYLFDGSSWLEKEMKYKDLGLVIDTTIVAGATVYSNAFTNVQWVRNIVIFSSCDQAYTIGVVRVDSSGAESVNFGYSGLTTLNTNVSSTSFTGNTLGNSITTNNVNTNSAVFGYSVKFSLKNAGAGTTTWSKLKIQLLSLL